MSTIEFIKDKRFDFLGASFVHLDPTGLSCKGFVEKPDLKDWIGGMNFKNLTVVCHNSKFDISLLYHKFNINPPYVVDTRDLSRHQEARAKHKLEECAKRYGLPPKGTELEGLKGLHYEELTEEQRGYLIRYAVNDAEIETELFKILLPRMSRPEVELPLTRHTLDMYLDAVLRFDFSAAPKLIAGMQKEMWNVVNQVEFDKNDDAYKKKQISGDISFVKLLQAALPDGESVPTKAGKPTKNMIKLLGPGSIPAVAKDDEGTKLLQKHDSPVVNKLIEARLAVKSWPLHIKRIVNLEGQARARNGYLGVPLHYYGGHTARWSGAEKINFQNFGEHGHELVRKTKSLMLAPPGYRILGADLAQIEARALAVMARQEDLVEGFRRGEDVYSTFASDLFKSRVRKPTLVDPPPIAKVLGTRRLLGKQSILGLGYGMGEDTFLEKCATIPDLAPMVKKNEIDAEKIISLYRTKYAGIPKLWNSVENAFKWATNYSDTEELMCGLKFWSEGSTTFIQLPSGRVMRYPNVRILRYDTKWKYGRLWGSILVENVIQAVSRDIIAEHILKLANAGMKVVVHVHDSVAILIPEDQVKESIKTAREIMCTPPVWMKSVPLAIDTKVGRCYE
jgi:DNA polymerase III epsilon subunit-like protein